MQLYPVIMSSALFKNAALPSKTYHFVFLVVMASDGSLAPIMKYFLPAHSDPGPQVWYRHRNGLHGCSLVLGAQVLVGHLHTFTNFLSLTVFIILGQYFSLFVH